MDEPTRTTRIVRAQPRGQAAARCLCGQVRLGIDVPARWAWHDHGAPSRRAHGAAYATYVGCYRSRVRLLAGAEALTRYEDPETGAARSFCGRCGSPVLYERASAPTMVNIPRALFEAGTGREPLYHLNIDALTPWTYLGERLTPLKGFPGVVWTRPKRKRRDADLL